LPEVPLSHAPVPQDGSIYWLRNLYVCLFGAFTTILSMTLLLPFLPIYVQHLGVSSPAAIVQWSSVAFSVTFLAAALVAPLWGKLADRYGRKLILMRASLGMALAMSAMGLAHNVYQLVALRLLVGLAGGYASGSMILVATQTPKARTGWALGTLSTGVLAGNLLGPLAGGILPGIVGIRNTFFFAGGMIFIAFLATSFLIREDKTNAQRKAARHVGSAWALIPDRRPVLAMLLTALLLLLANMSVEPIITVYVAQLVADQTKVVLVSGLVMAAAALGSIVAAPRIGRLADRVGHWKVVVVCLLAAAVLLIPQAFVTAGWQLIVLRFLMGMALAGLLPCITALIRHSVPDAVSGNILGYSQSAQYAGQVCGPLLGGVLGAHFGMRSVFLVTSVLLFGGAAYNWMLSQRRGERVGGR
jgi:MFS family permease